MICIYEDYNACRLNRFGRYKGRLTNKPTIFNGRFIISINSKKATANSLEWMVAFLMSKIHLINFNQQLFKTQCSESNKECIDLYLLNGKKKDIINCDW